MRYGSSRSITASTTCRWASASATASAAERRHQLRVVSSPPVGVGVLQQHPEQIGPGEIDRPRISDLQRDPQWQGPSLENGQRLGGGTPSRP